MQVSSSCHIILADEIDNDLSIINVIIVCTGTKISTDNVFNPLNVLSQ